MKTRRELRSETAQYLNSLDRETLFSRFGITRVANLTGLDIIGVPVYSCIRPAGKIISVSAGKSLDPAMSRAGAIAEGIEFHTFENPTDNDHEFWLCPRENHDNWARSSNGQALGATFKDAFLQGIYEVVERDQVTLRRISFEKLGVYPNRVHLPQSLDLLISKCYAASLHLYLMACSSDITLPVYWAVLVDTDGQTGAFAGWGCHLTPDIAAERAILESIQSRLVWIAGARDDIARRDFKTHKEKDPHELINEMEALPVLPFPEILWPELSVEEELKIVLGRLRQWKDVIRFKHIYLGDLHSVKVIIDGMEQPKLNDKWREVRWTKLRESFMSGQVCTV